MLQLIVVGPSLPGTLIGVPGTPLLLVLLVLPLLPGVGGAGCGGMAGGVGRGGGGVGLAFARENITCEKIHSAINLMTAFMDVPLF